MARVLIVDDEAPVRKILRRMVVADGHETIEAETAEQALELMAQSPAGVAFVDIQMPGKGGLWLAAELRRLYPTTAMILATGVTNVPPSTSMQSGITAYLLKPFSPDSVSSELKSAVKWHDETAKAGPKHEDSIDKIQSWLDSLA
jgi:two-component system KDP operon response regulator KdpE